MRNYAVRVLFATCAAVAVLGTIYIIVQLVSGNPIPAIGYIVAAAAWIVLIVTGLIRFYRVKHGYEYSRAYDVWFKKK